MYMKEVQQRFEQMEHAVIEMQEALSRHQEEVSLCMSRDCTSCTSDYLTEGFEELLEQIEVLSELINDLPEGV